VRFFPITARLNPFAGTQNWAYLIYSTAVTRFVTGLARVYEDRPSAQDPALTEPEKRQACLERFFVETIGTTSYLLFLHLGQDIASKFLEPKLKENLKQLLSQIDDSKMGLSAKQASNAKNALTSIYGDQSSPLIARSLYGYKTPDKKLASVSLVRMKSLMKDDSLFHYVRSSIPLDGFTSMIRRRAAVSVLAGVAASAVFGGFVTQLLNDRLFAPTARRILEKRYNVKSGNVVPATPDAPQQVISPQVPNTMVGSVPAVNTYSSSPFSTQSSPAKPVTNYSMPMPGAWANALGGLPR
jgi:hypothetical protein